MTRLILVAAAAVGSFARTVPDPNAPRPLYAVPVAVGPNHAGKVTLRGRKLDGVKQVTCTVPGVSVKLIGTARKANPPPMLSADRTGDTEVDVELKLPKDFRGDALPLVLTAGKRACQFSLQVDPPGVVTEKEPNNAFTQAQKLPILPATYAGTINGDRDVDVVTFTLTAGQTVRVEALDHGSPADLVVTAWDADRHILAAADDRAGHALTFTAAHAGSYFVSVSDANDQNGGLFGYRLRVTAGK